MKDKILAVILFLILATIWLGSIAYIVEAGNCQQRAKYYHTFDDDTPAKCMNWRNWK